LKALALAGVGAYRRYVSPHKGYACAYRVHRSGLSCSAHAERVIRRFGLLRGLALVRRRLGRCGDVHRQHHGAQRVLQRGSCDLPCDIPCDGSEVKGLGHCLDCADCGCDGDRRGERKQERESKRRRERERKKENEQQRGRSATL
jgi:uncharacterized protein